MATNLNLRTVTVICTHCNREVREPLLWLASNPQFRCPHCDGRIAVAEQAIRDAIGTIDDPEKVVADALSNLGKPVPYAE